MIIKEKSPGFKSVYSTSTYKCGELVYSLTGLILDKPTRESIQTGINEHIEDMFGMYMNHSFNCNTKVVDRTIVAIKHIDIGDEITFNYNDSETSMASPFIDNDTGLIVSGFNNNKKIIVCIRHGKSTHNVDKDYMTTKNIDSNLTDYGVSQACNLSKNESFQNIKKDIELVVVSPLSRTLQTAKHVFSNHKVQMISLDEIMEYPQGSHTPNIRKTRTELQEKYPDVSFYINEKSKHFKCEETLGELQNRIDAFKEWILDRREKTIALVGHNSFLKVFGNCKNDIPHCKPFIVNL